MPLSPETRPHPRGHLPEPAPAERYDLLFWSLFTALMILGLAPVWVSQVLPILDALAHEHLITIIHDYDRSPLFQQHYERVDAIVPYLTYYKLVDWLAWIAGVEWANRVVLSLCLALLPVSTLHLLKAAGHSRWLVLGVFPWMLNADFFMGFLNYLMSLPVFFWVLAAHLRFMRRPGLRGALLVMGLLVFLAITHYLLWAVAICLLPTLGVTIGARYGWRKALLWPWREAVLCLPSIGILLPWFLSYFVLAEDVRSSDQALIQATDLVDRLKQIYAGEHATPLGNIHQIFDRMFNQFLQGSGQIKGPLDFLLHRPGELASSLWLLGLGLWLAALNHTRIRRQPGEADPSATPLAPSPTGADAISGLRGTTYLGQVLLLVTIAYFLLPQHLSRPIILYGVNFRLVEVLAILSIVVLPVRPLAPPREVRFRVWLGTLALFSAAVVMPIMTTGAFMMASTEYGSIREAYGSIPSGRKVLTLRATRHSQYLREPIFSGIGQFYAISQRGYVPYSFADSSSKPMVVRREQQVPCPIWYDHFTFTMKDHGRFYDTIVVYRAQGERPGRWESDLKGWELSYQRDRWKVYNNPHPDPWPEPTRQDLELRQKGARVAVLLLPWVGLGDEDGRQIDLCDLFDLLGLPCTRPRDAGPVPTPDGPLGPEMGLGAVVERRPGSPPPPRLDLPREMHQLAIDALAPFAPGAFTPTTDELPAP